MTARMLSLALATLLVPGATFGNENQPGPCSGDETIGQVVAVSGSVAVVAPGDTLWALRCDDALRCEEIVTAPGASLAFVSGDVLVRVGGDSRVALNGSEGAPELFVQRGAVRSTDARGAGAAPAKLLARDLVASATGADLELSASDAGSRLCVYDGGAAVDAGPSARRLGAGQCLARGEGGHASSPAADAAPGLDAPGFCSFELALDDHLAPGDVAAPEPVGFRGGDPASDIVRDPCDDPGSGCTGGDAIPFEDPDPVPGCGVPGVDCGTTD